MSQVIQSDHVMLKAARIMLVAFIKIGLQSLHQEVTGSVILMINLFAAGVESEMTVSSNVKMQRAVISAAINPECGDWMVSHSSVNAVQAVPGGVATASGQIVNVCSLNVMIQTAFTKFTSHGHSLNNRHQRTRRINRLIMHNQ
eukprot:5278628-Amphidinium_carterae.5